MSKKGPTRLEVILIDDIRSSYKEKMISSDNFFVYKEGYVNGAEKSLESSLSHEQTIQFFQYIQDNYYYSSSCWTHWESNEVHSKEKILELFIKSLKK